MQNPEGAHSPSGTPRKLLVNQKKPREQQEWGAQQGGTLKAGAFNKKGPSQPARLCVNCQQQNCF